MTSGHAKKDVARGLLLIGGANLLAGISYPAQKLALEGLPPALVSALRSALAALLMAVLIWRSGRGWGRYRASEWGRIAFLGVLAYGLPMWLGIIGVHGSSAANGSILILLEPVTIVLLSWMLLRERLSLRTIATVSFGLAGALMIVFEGGEVVDLLGSDVARGNLWLALHGVLWGCYTPVAKPLMDRGHDALALSALSLLFSLVLLGPLSLLELRAGLPPAGELEGSLGAALGWTLFLAITSSFGATLMWLASLKWISGSQVAACVFLQPLAGVFVGMTLLGESLSAAGMLGASLIALGVLMTTLPSRGSARSR